MNTAFQTSNPKKPKTSRVGTAFEQPVGDPVQLYLNTLSRPLLTREQEVALAMQVEEGERELLRAFFDTPHGLSELGKIREDLLEGRIAVDQILRNVEQGRDAAISQRSRVLRAFDGARHCTGPTLVDELVDLHLHPAVFGRLRASVDACAGHGSSSSLVQIRVQHARRAIQRAKNEFIESNLRLVVSLARKYRNRGLDFLDIIQEGNVALMHAIDKFDYRRGHRLATYASWWIRQHIDRAIAEKAATIRVPAHIAEVRSRIRRARYRLERNGVAASPAQLAEETRLPLDKIELVLGLAREPIKLEAPLTADGESCLGDVVANDNSRTPEEEVSDRRERARARALLTTLSERERSVLQMRFALDGTSERTLKEIGEIMSLSRERVRQIEANALRKLRDQA